MLPGKPSASKEKWAYHKAVETTKYLESLSGSPVETAVAASKLLEAALASGDTATAYLLAGKDTPMAVTYARLGVDAGLRHLYFAPVLAAADPGRDQKGAKLLARLQRTGRANGLRTAQVSVAAALHYQRNG